MGRDWIGVTEDGGSGDPVQAGRVAGGIGFVEEIEEIVVRDRKKNWSEEGRGDSDIAIDKPTESGVGAGAL